MSSRDAVALSALIACIGVVSPVAAGVAIDDAAWLAGCWESSTAARSVEEQWGTERGETRRVEFSYHWVGCPA